VRTPPEIGNAFTDSTSAASSVRSVSVDEMAWASFATVRAVTSSAAPGSSIAIRSCPSGRIEISMTPFGSTRLWMMPQKPCSIVALSSASAWEIFPSFSASSKSKW
jgi:hypothetical protein